MGIFLISNIVQNSLVIPSFCKEIYFTFLQKNRLTVLDAQKAREEFFWIIKNNVKA